MRSLRRNLELLQAMEKEAAEFAGAIAQDAELAARQPEPVTTGSLWPKPNPMEFDAPPEALEAEPNATPQLQAQTEAIPVTPAPSMPQPEIGFVPEADFKAFAIPPHMLLNNGAHPPEPAQPPQ